MQPQTMNPALKDQPTQYQDFLMRCNLADTGQVPAVGGLCASPDIIPYGSTPVADPRTTFADFSKDYGTSVLANAPNYIYVRGQNLSDHHVNAEVRLFWSKASLLLWPFKWLPNKLPLASEKTTMVLPAEAGEKVVSDDRYLWIPEATSDGDHYCLVGQVITPDHPDDIPPFSSVGPFAEWIATNRNMAWRNVQTVSVGAPDWSQNLDYYQGVTSEEVHFLLTLKGLQPGCAVAISSPPPGPNLEKTTITEPGQDVGVVVTVPANYSGTITYSFWSNGITPARGASVELRAIYIPPAARMLAVRGMSPSALGLPLALYQHRQAEYEKVGPIHAYVLGAHKTVFSR